MSKIAIIVTAAGSGTRLAAGVPKAAAMVGGKSILAHALDMVTNFEAAQIVVTVPVGSTEVGTEVEKYPNVIAVPGGSTRAASVYQALRQLSTDIDYVLIHDAARCFTPERVFERVILSLKSGQTAVIPTLPVIDAIKKVEDHKVIGDVPRDTLNIVQTPQGFVLKELLAAHESYKGDMEKIKDDAMLVSSMGGQVYTVVGDEKALKITRPFDLKIAELLKESD
ncbi:MAG: 2-C-methyl-D-erythritol 4-phosphate cytidylyltransferase [Micrococcaceae bacterium]